MDGLLHGKCASANSNGRTPKNLFILPGGIAEIFTSTPGRHAIVFKDRRGLIKISLQTGAELLPSYVFGGTDFFHNLATSDNFLSRLSRKYKVGLTYFWWDFFSKAHCPLLYFFADIFISLLLVCLLTPFCLFVCLFVCLID